MSFEPQNDLERSLMKATHDPAHRPQFYKDLVQSDIFCVHYGESPSASESTIVLEKGTSIKTATIEIEGKPYTPLFSSLPRLQAAITSDVAYLKMNALAFLEMTIGSDLILNPGAEYGKEITPAEAASIVDGSIWRADEHYVVQEEVDVLIGQPQNYPQELVDALARLFETKEQVQRAWLAHFFNPNTDEKPHTLIAVEVSGGYEEVLAEAGLVARNVQIPDPPVDFIPITGLGGIEDYFLNDTEPFYAR